MTSSSVRAMTSSTEILNLKWVNSGQDELRGAQSKFWFDIMEDESYSGMGNVIAYMVEVYMQVEKKNELTLPELLEFIRSEKCRVLYNVIEHQGESINDKIGKIYKSHTVLLILYDSYSCSRFADKGYS